MKYIFFPLRLLWRIWFYILIFTTILILLPLFIILTSKEKYYPNLWKLLRFWSYIMIYGMGFHQKIKFNQKTKLDQNYMFVANHVSLMDPWNLMFISKNPIVFVGKKELTKIPLFGYFYNKAVITVDRSNIDSRKEVFAQVKHKLNLGYSIAIYPEGLVPTEDVVLAPFKNGAFSIAINHQIPIVPIVSYDGKRLFSWDFFRGHPGIFRFKQLKFIETNGMTNNSKLKIRNKIFNSMNMELLSDELYMKDTLLAKNTVES